MSRHLLSRFAKDKHPHLFIVKMILSKHDSFSYLLSHGKKDLARFLAALGF